MSPRRRPEGAAAISEHPLPTHATGDVLGEVLDQLGPRPDLAVVTVTGNHAGALEDVARTAATVLQPRVLLGAASASVIGGHREVEQSPAIAVWAARLGRVEPVRVRTARLDDGWAVTGLPATAADGPRTLVLFADPHSFPTDGVLDQLGETCPELQVVGGLVAGALGPGGARLVLDDEVHTGGAVGVLLEPGADVETVVSHGARAVGDPLVVTRVDGRHVLELAGQPAIDRLREVLESLDPAERTVAAGGLQIGIVIDEGRAEFGRDDFRIRPMVGADMASGAVVVGDALDVGQTIQFHLRDALGADDDLRAALAGRSAAGALVVTSTARGHRLFGYPDHDADVISTLTGSRATGGIFTEGEIAPVGGRNLLHTSSTGILLVGPERA
ncbi:FIST signal transduction protein [Actinomarinicola tropica]|uniref:FIST signal transduction protein n=1 Tax=Actinomarinicola tropica TaxID=2789776 RepID=UPI00189777A5|nr:FIST N-terminal domain-containing protein [Actinomarinicola tropica]